MALIVVCGITLAISVKLVYVIPFLLGTAMDMPDPDHPGQMTSGYSPGYAFLLELIGLFICIAIIAGLLRALKKV